MSFLSSALTRQRLVWLGTRVLVRCMMTYSTVSTSMDERELTCFRVAEAMIQIEQGISKCQNLLVC